MGLVLQVADDWWNEAFIVPAEPENSGNIYLGMAVHCGDPERTRASSSGE
jgi:hypothetical protein